MTIRPKLRYHPYFVMAFYLNCLPEEWLEHIPRSTRHEWQHRDQLELYGHQWYLQNQALFSTLKEVASHRRLLQVNRAILRAIVLHKFINDNLYRINQNIFGIREVIWSNLSKVIKVVGIKITLKCIQQTYSWFAGLRKKRCNSSLLSLCRIRHPAQLLSKEIHAIIAYCSDPRFLHWPLASVFYQMRKEGRATFTLSTFYKYIARLQLKRSNPIKRRKNHYTGIRASAPLHILHADTTVFRTADNVKNYIYLVQDNFSRAILSYKVSRECKAQHTFDNLQFVRQNYLIPAGTNACQLITDDGSENAGAVKDLTSPNAFPAITHLIAQRDIQFFNSMIEAANKQLKYRFLYHHHIPDFKELLEYVRQAIEDFNNRPHDVLHGLAPLEVLHGIKVDHDAYRRQTAIAKVNRIAENKKASCCYYSF